MSEIGSSGAVPALEKLMSFAGQRQRLIAHNIANISTPNFRQMDVSVSGFQQALGQAIDRKRDRGGAGDLEIQETSELEIDAQGGLILRPGTNGPGVLAHDRNNRDLETLMKDLVENAATYRLASDLLRSRFEILRSAIAERV